MYLVRSFGLLVIVMVATSSAFAQPVSIWVANAGFELPVFSDGVFGLLFLPQQGCHGWTFSNSGLYNPPANTYSAAGGNGTPNGAEGIQVAFSTLRVANTIAQRLYGPDNIFGNGDDPLLTASPGFIR